jgi:hypothetical protein
MNLECLTFVRGRRCVQSTEAAHFATDSCDVGATGKRDEQQWAFLKPEEDEPLS